MQNAINLQSLIKPSPDNPNAGNALNHPASTRPTGEDPLGDGTTGPAFPVRSTFPDFELASLVSGLPLDQRFEDGPLPTDAGGEPSNSIGRHVLVHIVLFILENIISCIQTRPDADGGGQRDGLSVSPSSSV